MIKALLEAVGIDSWIVLMVCSFSLIASAIGLLLYMVAPSSHEEPVSLIRVDFATKMIFSLFVGFVLLAAHPQITMLPELLRMTGALGQVLQTYKNVIGLISLLLFIIDLFITYFGKVTVVKSIISKILTLFGFAGFTLYLCTAIGQEVVPFMLLVMWSFHHISVEGFGGKRRK